MIKLAPHLNYAPETTEHIHIMGICGTGMAGSVFTAFNSRKHGLAGIENFILALAQVPNFFI